MQLRCLYCGREIADNRRHCSEPCRRASYYEYRRVAPPHVAFSSAAAPSRLLLRRFGGTLDDAVFSQLAGASVRVQLPPEPTSSAELRAVYAEALRIPVRRPARTLEQRRETSRRRPRRAQQHYSVKVRRALQNNSTASETCPNLSQYL